jgi:hypothetical protein
LRGTVYVVLLRLDSTGSCPVLRGGDALPVDGEIGVRYRFVAQTDDYGEAVAVVELLRRRLQEGAAAADERTAGRDVALLASAHAPWRSSRANGSATP